MANNCYGKPFIGGGGDTGCEEVQLDSGAYLADFWGYPSSEQSQFANDGLCESLATQLYDATCEPDTGFSNSTIAPVRDSQIVQKRRIPPLGPKATMRQATGVSEEEVGRTMAIYAYAGVFAGTLALYKYFDLFKKDKTKLLIGYGIVFAGLALGSAVGSYRVEQKKA